MQYVPSTQNCLRIAQNWRYASIGNGLSGEIDYWIDHWIDYYIDCYIDRRRRLIMVLVVVIVDVILWRCVLLGAVWVLVGSYLAGMIYTIKIETLWEV